VYDTVRLLAHAADVSRRLSATMAGGVAEATQVSCQQAMAAVTAGTPVAKWTEGENLYKMLLRVSTYI